MCPARKPARRSRGPRKQSLRGPAVAEPHLPSETELRRIAERILRLSDADETEVEVDAAVYALTRFANNTIHQNVAEQTLNGAHRLRRADCARHHKQDG